MSNLIAYMCAYNHLKEAEAQFAEATKRAFPLGARVISHAKKAPIAGVVDGYKKDGRVSVLNDRTKKSHWASPMLGQVVVFE